MSQIEIIYVLAIYPVSYWLLLYMSNSSMHYYKVKYEINEFDFHNYIQQLHFPANTYKYVYSRADFRKMMEIKTVDLKTIRSGKLFNSFMAFIFFTNVCTVVILEAKGILLFYFLLWATLYAILFVKAWNFGYNLKDYKSNR